jgi:hypothetical protein
MEDFRNELRHMDEPERSPSGGSTAPTLIPSNIWKRKQNGSAGSRREQRFRSPSQ